MTDQYSLTGLGWKHFFQQQLSLEELERFTCARVIGQERTELHVLSSDGKFILPVIKSMPAITVGDWVLVEERHRFVRLLDRFSLFYRKAAGTKVAAQLIAANIDTVFIVSSLNLDFNLNRIERYLVLAKEAGVNPVLVLTKLDCCDTPDAYIEQIRSLNLSLDIITVNSLEPVSVEKLRQWCATGETVAFLGSSGVGKSTLINTMLGVNVQRTHAIREDDKKGRHTTTGRSLHILTNGGLLLDTPGMRELQLVESAHGLDETFPDIIELAACCKFSDCQHQTEPGCAVREAIAAGKLDQRRLSSYIKLMKEQAFNNATLAERRARDRYFGRYIKTVVDSKKKIKSSN